MSSSLAKQSQEWGIFYIRTAVTGCHAQGKRVFFAFSRIKQGNIGHNWKWNLIWCNLVSVLISDIYFLFSNGLLNVFGNKDYMKKHFSLMIFVFKSNWLYISFIRSLVVYAYGLLKPYLSTHLNLYIKLLDCFVLQHSVFKHLKNFIKRFI